MTKWVAVAAARRMCAVALGVAVSIGSGIFDTLGAQAASRFPCPAGQIYRVSKKICVPKGAESKLSAGWDKPTESLVAPRGDSPDLPRVNPAPIRDTPTPIEPEAPQRLRTEAASFDPKLALESVLKLGFAREKAPSQLEDLVVFCRMALKTYRRADAPFEWAAVRNNLANALAVIDETSNGTAGLEEAVALYREVLKERTRERAPRDWATIQTNLAEVLTILGDRENAISKLAEAAAIKREALVWAKHTGDEGVALMRLAERLGDQDKARTALAQIDTALTTIQGGDHGSLLATYFEEQLPKARALVEQLGEPRAIEPPVRR